MKAPSTRTGDPRMALLSMLQVVVLLSSLVLVPGVTVAESAPEQVEPVAGQADEPPTEATEPTPELEPAPAEPAPAEPAPGPVADKAEPAPDAAKNTEPVEPARDSEKPVKDAESPAKDSAKSDTSDEAPAKQGSAKRAPEAGKAPAALTVRLYPRKVKLYPGGRAVVSAWTCPADDRSPFGKDRVPGTRDDECSAVRAKWSVKDPVRAHLSNQVGYKTRITLDKLKKTKLIAQYDGMERRARVLVKDAPAKVRPAAEAASKAPKSTKAPEAEATKAAPDPLAEESTEVVAEAAAQAVEPSPEPSVEPTLDPAADTTPALTAPTPDPSAR